MGQQQLALIVLAVIVVASAILVGMVAFRGNATEANRSAIITDLLQYGSKAQVHFRRSRQFGGGEQSFDSFYLSAIDTGNSNGSYSVTVSQPTGAVYVSGNNASVQGNNNSRIYIIGCGKEMGDNASYPVKVYVEVTADSIKSTILN